MALRWRAEGAQIVGGCCGVGPEHISAARERLAGTRPGRAGPPPARRVGDRRPQRRPAGPRARGRAGRPSPGATPTAARLYPLEFPDLGVDSGVFVPTEGSFLVWRHLFRERIGAGRRCLDVGCGSGLQTVQLARNGAAHVHGIDLDAGAVGDTLTNAFRNGVADRVTAATVDLFPWVPEERYEVIVASLYQTPVDPFRQVSTHRPVDYWGRNMLDHLIRMLPEALDDDGVAYVMQLSILSQERTAQLLDERGLEARVADFGFFPFTEHFRGAREQIERVESLSDAHHLRLGGADVMVAYLLEIRRRA